MHLFTWVDYVVLVATIVISLGIGIYQALAGGRQNTTEEYLMGGRKMSIFPVAASLTVSYLSAISIVGFPAEVYYYGITFSCVLLGGVCGTLCAAFCYIPALYPLHMTSINEYLGYRFNSRALVLLGLFFQLVTQVMYSGIVLYAPAALLEIMAGFPTWASMLLMCLASTIYTTFGGLKAVVWTDCFQALVIFAGLLITVVKGTSLTGGVTEVWHQYSDGGRAFLDFSPSPFRRQTVWGVVTAEFMFCALQYTTTQNGLQRYSVVPSLKDAKRVALWSIVPYVLIEALACLSGIVAFAYFSKQECEPFTAGYIPSQSQILPYFVMHVINYPGVPGLFCACVLCGTLSNLSTSLSALTALTWSDLLANKLRNLTESRKTAITKIMTAGFGVVAVSFGFMVGQFGGTIVQIGALITGALAAPSQTLFTAGLLFPRTNWKSVSAGVVAAMCVTLFIGVGGTTVKAHQAVLPGDTSGCLRAGNITAMGIRNITYVDAAATHSSMFTTELPESRPTDDDINIVHGWRKLFQLSHYFIGSLALAIGLTVSFLTSFLPGFHTAAGTRSPHLYFPCIKALVTKTNRSREYEGVQVKEHDITEATSI